MRIVYYAVVFIISTQLLYAGSLNPSGPPGPTGKTLSDVYARISSGTEAGPHALKPVAGPGSTGVTISQLYNALPSGGVTTAATADVVGGKTFITRGSGVMVYSTGAFTGHELPDTGLTSSYTSTFGEDHDYQPAVSQPSYTMYVDASLVVSNDVNTAKLTLDNRTGLMWATDGSLSGKVYGFNAALAWVTNLNTTVYAGYSDWRLPNYKESLSIIDYQVYDPCTDPTKFRNTYLDWYWTSTQWAKGGKIYFVKMDRGWSAVYATTDWGYIRPVRGGP